MALVMNYNYELTYINTKIQLDPKFKSEFNEVKEQITETLVVKDAYFQIVKIEGNKEKMDIVLSVYKDNTKKYVLETRVYSFNPSVSFDSPNNFKQGYEYLKTLPEFDGAIDVLEDEDYQTYSIS
ncbi:hypothetical protein [Niallia circulans]|uniref:hypothetical protein n=1 Tax=Niallia circulans TaxID=1397 RepID=UPI0026F097A7|nr:hypothetical protein [Niallia circulans]